MENIIAAAKAKNPLAFEELVKAELTRRAQEKVHEFKTHVMREDN